MADRSPTEASGEPTAPEALPSGSPRFARYVALGDSFTEGVGDELPDGSIRGWADLVAIRAAARYANLAVRGKLLGPIIDEQLEPALSLQPDLVTFAGGGNDMLRPRSDVVALARLVDLVIARLVDSGATVVMFTGADPSDHLPLGRVVRAHGDVFAESARAVALRRGALLVDLWPVRALRDPRYWAEDRLHLNAGGHQQVAARVLDALGIERPGAWTATLPAEPIDADISPADRIRYYRSYVLPWVQRRLTGRSSGDNRPPKYPRLAVPVQQSVAD